MGVLDDYINSGYVIGDAVKTPPAVEPPAIQAIDAADLAGKEFAPLVEPVKGLIVEGLTLLCGASKIGKSWLVLQMCSAVAAGVPFLGRQTSPGAVLYLAYEDSERRLKDRLQQQHSAPGGNLQFDTRIIPLDGGLLDALTGWVERNPSARLIVIDTLQKVRGQAPSRANAYAEDYKVMARLKAFADLHHVAVVIVHHLNKLQDVSDPFDRISGSTGLMGAADTAIIITRRRGEADAIVSFTGRDVYGEDFQMRFEDCRWKVCDPAVLARERYEGATVVKAVKRFTRQATFDGTHAASYEDFRAWADSCGLCVGVNQRETRRQLEQYATQLAQYDGIHLSLDKRVGSKRGFAVVGGTTDD